MADDGMWGEHGERLQRWMFRHDDVRGRTFNKGFSQPELGLVIARYFPDEDGNTSSVYTEYDVFFPRQQITLKNLVVMMPFQGVSGGQQITLHPSNAIPDMSNPNAIHQNVQDSDGDLVCVQFIGGKWPVIVGTLNHLRTSGAANWHTDSTDGEVAALSYNTTRARINSDGNIEVDLDDSSAPPDRSLIINAGGKTLLTVKYNDGAGETRIELGSGALEKVVLGESFQTWFDSEVAGHTHKYTPALHPGTPNAATTLGAVASLPNSVLTEKVKAEG